MIVDTIILLAGIVVSAVASAFQTITFVLPNAYFEALSWIYANLSYMSPVFPVDTLIQALILLSTFFVYFYLIKLILWVYGLFKGKSHHIND